MYLGIYIGILYASYYYIIILCRTKTTDPQKKTLTHIGPYGEMDRESERDGDKYKTKTGEKRAREL